MMNIIHIISSVGPRSFGLGPVALNLAREQNSLGMNSNIWCLDTDDDIRWASASSGLPVNRMRRFPLTGPSLFCLSLGMERAAGREVWNGSVIHQHAIWDGLSRVTSLLQGRKEIARVITPHGSLDKWALKKSWWKKYMALTFYEKKNLHNASCLHAVGENEISDCRDFGLSNPVAVIPNGISSDWLESRGDAEAFRRQFEIPADKRVLLFLSRITPKKGLPMLLDALHKIQKDFTDWQLIIAGADEFGHQATIENLILEKMLGKSVKLVGPLFGEIKRDAFSAADIFILPSHSEGAPIVILESLAAEVPVLATKASPWQNLETHGCGWWTDISAEAIADALVDAVNRSPAQLKLMGNRGKELVAAEYTWARSAQMTMELYEWLHGRRGRPEFVVVD